VPEFFNTVAPADAVAVLKCRLDRRLHSEPIPAVDSLHRVTSALV